ncbi:MAG: hypothetical protein IJX55_06155, partial [Clostridia bacterium]|nr:hypothetical protein [Clostridia bacterium]
MLQKLMSGLVETFTSGTAIIIYIIVIIALIAILLISAMASENKSEKQGSTAVSTTNGSEKAKNSAEETGTERFCMLSEIDRRKNTYGQSAYDIGITLEGICENFRNYASTKLKLYYDIEDIRKFVSGMAVSRLIILQGMSGTGKTSLAHAYGAFTD